MKSETLNLLIKPNDIDSLVGPDKEMYILLYPKYVIKIADSWEIQFQVTISLVTYATTVKNK